MRILLHISLLFFILPLTVFAGIIFEAPSGQVSMAEANPLGIWHRSQRYSVKAISKRDTAEIPVVLDTPQGAVINIVGEPEAEVTLANGRALRSAYRNGSQVDDLGVPDVGKFLGVEDLQPGSYQLKVAGLVHPGAVVALVSQPASPLVLKARVSPMAVKGGDLVSLEVQLEDDFPVKQASISAQSPTGGLVSLARHSEGVYRAEIEAPEVETLGPIEFFIKAKGVRYDGTPFHRDANAMVLVAKAQSGIKKPVSVDAEGNFNLQLLPADEVTLRLDVFYGRRGKALAIGQTYIKLQGESVSIPVTKPEFAQEADRVLIRLLNMDTLGVEESFLLELEG